MELRQLRDFVALAEELHYARAAARLGIDQSPLSRRIKEFEAGLGVLLFARTSRGTQLTPRGEFLLPWARAILSAAEQVQKLLQVRPPASDVVRVELCDDVPTRGLFAVLAAFQQSHSSTSVSYAERQCSRQVDEVRSELADLGFGLFLQSDDCLIAEPLWRASACLVLPRDHSLANEQAIGARELGDTRIGLIEREASDPALRARLESLTHHLTQNPHVADAGSLKVLLTMVSAGSCVGVVGPAQAEMIQPVDFAVRPITHPRANFTTHMLYRRREAGASVKGLMEAVRLAWSADYGASAGTPDRAP
jgi:DNA-binding transcriptional LysR family regulator